MELHSLQSLPRKHASAHALRNVPVRLTPASAPKSANARQSHANVQKNVRVQLTPANALMVVNVVMKKPQHAHQSQIVLRNQIRHVQQKAGAL